MQKKELLFWIWLAEGLGAGNGDFRFLLDSYGSPYEIYSLENGTPEQTGKCSEKTLRNLSKKDLTEATKILETCEKERIGILTFSDPDYPQVLREIKNPPVLLYYFGTVPKWNERLSIGVVGTRKMSAYGLQTAYRISFELAKAGAITVSGMAAGIDGVSAVATLEAGGTPVAVLGCGIDVVYPACHRPLMKRIAKQGILLSEYPPGTRPVSYHFPQRNRIISGISQGTLVVEAGLRSGSLITAKEAVMQGRDVFAVPSDPVGGLSAGTNGLLRDGAVFTLETADILKKYEYLYAETLHAEVLTKIGNDTQPNYAMLVQAGVLEPQKEENREEPKNASSTPVKREKIKKEEKKTAPEPPPQNEDLSGLPQIQREILSKMPRGETVQTDVLMTLGYPFGELIGALTILEISGKIEKMPGSSYRRK